MKIFKKMSKQHGFKKAVSNSITPKITRLIAADDFADSYNQGLIAGFELACDKLDTLTVYIEHTPAELSEYLRNLK